VDEENEELKKQIVQLKKDFDAKVNEGK